MKLYANLIKDNLKKDRDSQGWSLTLEMKQITMISNLCDFLSPSQQPLIHLDVSYNYLKSIEPMFFSLKSLKWLDLSANHIEKIENLSELRDLEYLNLSTNRISSLENLNSLLSLRVLDLSMNYLSEFGALNLPKLEFLNVLGNEIREFGDLQGLISLKQLDISKNGLENLEFLAKDGVFRELLSLKCNYNRLNYQYFEEIVQIMGKFADLQEIELIGNELTLHKEYKFLSLWCRKLQIIDGVAISSEKVQHLKSLKIDKELEELQEKAQDEYLSRIRLEHENKQKHKKLLAERREFIEKVFENHEETLQKDLADFAGFSAETQKSQEITALPVENLKKWRETLRNNEKERERLTKVALKQQEDIQRNILSSKLASTKLTQKLLEIALKEPKTWQELKRKELAQVFEEEQAQIQRDREIPVEESEEKEDDLIDALEEEFKAEIANVLSDKIREIQTKDLQKERAEAANLIKKTLKSKKNAEIVEKADSEGKSEEKLIKLQRFEEEDPNIEKFWGNYAIERGDSVEFVEEIKGNVVKFEENEEFSKKNTLNLKKSETKDVDWKSKRQEFMEKQRKLKEEKAFLAENSKKSGKTSKKCTLF